MKRLVVVWLLALLERDQLVVLMGGPDGGPINEAKLAFVLFNEAGQSYRAEFTQVASGEYRTAAPRAAQGVYTLLLRDTTFPGEALEAKAVILYPLSKPLSLRLPASRAAGPDVPVLIALTVAPVALSLAVLIFILVSRPKPKRLEPASLEEIA